ncbi:MAG TPA: hypothetical protein PLD62_00395 [Candidatus Cloacimonadota bacterium]|nr:hypothetical protein [Candidatus Cloacimonadota bacterium]
MKKILWSLFFLTAVTTVFAQTDVAAVQRLLYGSNSFTLEEQIQYEKNQLRVLQEEIAYYKNIIELRAAILQLYKTGNIDEIQDHFSRRTDALDDLLSDHNLQASALAVNEQSIIYSDIPAVRDRLLFNQAKLASQQKKYPEAQNNLEKIVNDYSASSVWIPAFNLLAELYFTSGQDEDLIALMTKHTVPPNEMLSFFYANALYNLGKYPEAKTEFETLLSNDDCSEIHAFQAKSILALIEYFNGNTDQAISSLTELTQTKDIPQTELNFALLNLGRIQYLNDTEKAFPYFETYRQLNENITDDILYEIATYYFQNQSYEMARSYLHSILEKPQKSEYFVPANFMLIVSEFLPGDPVSAEPTIDALMQNNATLIDDLNSRYFLLERYQKLQKQLARIDSTDLMYDNIQAQLSILEVELSETQEKIAAFYGGMDQNKQAGLQLLEAEYKAYCRAISEIDALTEIARKMPKSAFTAYLNREISFTDSSLVTLQVMEFLQAKPFITPQDYLLARNLAAEKILLQTEMLSWQEILSISETKSYDDLSNRIRIYMSLASDDMAAYDRIADYLFRYKQNGTNDEYIASEVAAIQKNRAELIAMKSDISASFDNLISHKLQRENDEMNAEFTNLKVKYDEILNSVQHDINLENDEYEFNLLDLLFQNTIQMDREYNELQKKVKK